MSTSGANGASAAASTEAVAPPGRDPDHLEACPRCGAGPASTVAIATPAHLGQANPTGLVEVRLQTTQGTGSRRLDLRFIAVSLFPTVLLALSLGWLIGSGGVRAEPDPGRLATTLDDLSGAELLGLSLLVFVVAVLLHPFSAQRLRLLEGYWDGSPMGPLARIGLARHRKRRKRLDCVIHAKPKTAKETRRWYRAAHQLDLYPDDNRLLPTRLGNVLRAAEDRAGQRYGLDTITSWPRLYPYVTDPLARTLREARTQLDSYVSLCIVFFVASAMLAATLITDGLWVAVSAAAAVSGWLSYRAAVRLAARYGEAIAVAFDLHRFAMLEGLHYPMPTTLEEEFDFNQDLSKFLRSGRPLHGADHEHRYQHVGAVAVGLGGWSQPSGCPDHTRSSGVPKHDSLITPVFSKGAGRRILRRSRPVARYLG